MIIGTAGHIDHGKTLLVRRITGVDTDRLKEEKARGISIDLGFAYMPAPNGRVLGFVDVPGHERFIRNMVAGSTGIDFGLLVVAADDGIMPQTIEHLAILDILGLSRGIVALTKVDAVTPARAVEAAGEIRSALSGTALRDVAIMPVSSVTGDGLEGLRDALFAASKNFGERMSQGRFRLAVDRSFTISGAGTVVTGTVLSGRVGVGDHVLVSPTGQEARVRGIHAQDRPVTEGRTGDRCAINLVGRRITKEAITRGDFVLDPALHAPTDRIDATLRLLPGVAKPIRQWMPVRLHVAAAELGARIALRADETLAAGCEAIVQLVLERPIAAAVGDRFVIRDTSARHTLGGGRFLDLRAPARKRRTPERCAQLAALSNPDVIGALRALLNAPPGHVDLTVFARDRALMEEEVEALVLACDLVLLAQGPSAVVMSRQTYEQHKTEIVQALTEFHASHPDLIGVPLARLRVRSAPRLPPEEFLRLLQLMAVDGIVSQTGNWVRLAGHTIDNDIMPHDAALWGRVWPCLELDRFRPPRVRDIADRLAVSETEIRRILKLVARRGDVREIAHDHFFLTTAVAAIARIVRSLADEAQASEFSVAQFRDRLECGRKVALQILEYFDRHGLTMRRGEVRRLDPRRLEFFEPPVRESIVSSAKLDA